MDPKNIKLVRNESYFLVDKYKKDTCFLDLNKMNIVPLQLQIKHFYDEIHDDDGYNERIYIEDSDKRFFEKIRKIVIRLLN